MTDTHTTPYEKDYTSPAVPVIQVNGENVEVNETTERYVSCVGSTNLQGTHGTYMTLSLRNKHSPLCNQVVTACDSGRTLEESLRAHREHQQAKINESDLISFPYRSVSPGLISFPGDVLNCYPGTHGRLLADGL
jgi:hypothetical protein